MQYRNFFFAGCRYWIVLVTLLTSMDIVSGQRPASPKRYSEQSKKEQEKEKKKTDYKYPLWGGLSIGIDLFDPVAGLFGQEYGGYQLMIDANFYNRFFPVWEFGIAQANYKSEDLTLRYKTAPTFYNRIGMDYNFQFNKNDFYSLNIGARYGYSQFRYEIFDILNSGGMTPGDSYFNILNQQGDVHWAEFVGGLRVRVYKNLQMGWSIRYKFKLSVKNGSHSAAWYLPGYGIESMPLAFTYTISYRLPLLVKRKPSVEQGEQQPTNNTDTQQAPGEIRQKVEPIGGSTGGQPSL